MRNLLLSLMILACATTVRAQFRLASDGFVSQVSQPNATTYIVDVNLFSDLTGSGYSPTNILVGYRVFSQRGQLYEVNAVANATFSSATLTIIEIDNDLVDTEGPPIGQVQVYDPGDTEAIPQVPFSTTGATSVLQAAVVSYNSRVPAGSGGGVTPAQLADNSTTDQAYTDTRETAIRSDIPDLANWSTEPAAGNVSTDGNYLNRDGSSGQGLHFLSGNRADLFGAWRFRNNLNQFSVETQSAATRPVMNDLSIFARPDGDVNQATDYHGIDLNYYLEDNTFDVGNASVYPFESSVRFDAPTMNLAVPIYSFFNNVGNGDANGVVNYRAWAKAGTGSIGTLTGFQLNTLGGDIGGNNGITGFKVDDQTLDDVVGLRVGTLTGANSYGIISEAPAQIAGLEVGSVLDAPLTGDIFLNPQSGKVLVDALGGIDDTDVRREGSFTIGRRNSASSLFIHALSVNAGFSAGLGLYTSRTGTTTTSHVSGFGSRSGGEYGNLQFHTTSNSTVNETMTMTGLTNRVGIRTDDPQTPLDVNGTATIRGALNVDGNRIINLAAPVDDNDAVRKVDLDNIVVGSANFVYQNEAYAGSVAIDHDPGAPNTFITAGGDITLSVVNMTSGSGRVNVVLTADGQAVSVAGGETPGNHVYPSLSGDIVRLEYTIENDGLVWYNRSDPTFTDLEGNIISKKLNFYDDDRTEFASFSVAADAALASLRSMYMDPGGVYFPRLYFGTAANPMTFIDLQYTNELRNIRKATFGENNAPFILGSSANASSIPSIYSVSGGWRITAPGVGGVRFVSGDVRVQDNLTVDDDLNVDGALTAPDLPLESVVATYAAMTAASVGTKRINFLVLNDEDKTLTNTRYEYWPTGGGSVTLYISSTLEASSN